MNADRKPSLRPTAAIVADIDLFRSLIERMPVAIMLLDRDMRCVACNSRWMSDYQLGEMRFGPWPQHDGHAQGDERLRALVDRVLNGEGLTDDLGRYELPDGTAQRVRWSLDPWHGPGGDVAGVIVTSEFFTLQLEQALHMRLLSQELSLFIDIAENFALYMLDDEGRVTIWNTGAERLCGWTEGEVMGRSFVFMYGPSDQTRGLPMQHLELARQNGTLRDRSWRVRKDGSRFLADVTISRLERDGQLPCGFGHIVRDVTLEDTQARSIEASTVLLHAILQTVPDAMIVIDDKGTILYFSDTASTLFGYELEEVIGRNVSMLMPLPDSERHDGFLHRYHDTREPRIIGSSRRVLGLRKDGTTFPHTLQIGETSGGGQTMYAGFVRDLTDTEESENRMQELQRSLVHIGRVNDMGTLATALAHELNQPLMAIGNVVQTSAELLKDCDPRHVPTIQKALEEAGRETLRAGEIIKRLRRLVSRGEIERRAEAPRTLVRETCEMATLEARFRGVEIVVTVSDQVGGVLVDRVQIQQVLLNLLRNAIEAIDREGTLCVNVEPRGEMACFVVADSGPGVPQDRVAGLFDPFTTTSLTGMGVGLAICRTIVEAHGGKLWYEPGQERGARFLFTVPRFEVEKANG